MRSLIIGFVMMCALVVGASVVSAPVTSAAAPPSHVVATDVLNVCKGAGKDSAVCKERSKGANNPLTGTNGLILKITRIIAVVAGAAAIVILIISGLSMMLAAGDMQKVTKARNGFIYALVGLVIIVLAQAIVSFVVTRTLT